METILLAGGETFVVCLLADRFEFVERQRFDFLDRDVLASRQLFGGLFHSPCGRQLVFFALRVEAGQRPAIEQADVFRAYDRSEEHTSELQSLMRISYAVFCLKKKKDMLL